MSERIRSITGREPCDMCGYARKGWGDHIYSDGNTNLCPKCFKIFSEENQVIIHHYPGCVSGAVDEFYQWKGCEQFVIDNPIEKGWRYVHSDHKIMMERENHSEWWVLWHVHNNEIMKEIREEIPEWIPPKEGR